jgi:hypothetical protein
MLICLICQVLTGGTPTAPHANNSLSKGSPQMNDLSPTELTTIVGGATTKNDQITQQLTALQTSIKDATATNNHGGNNHLMMMVMMMAMRPQPTVIAAGEVAPAAPGAVVNIRTRVRRY